MYLSYVLGSRWYMLAISLALVFAWASGVNAAPVHAQARAARPSVPGAPAGVTALVDMNVIPMDSERVLANQTVLIEGGWITALGPSDQIKVPAGAIRIDSRGRYVIPGLADMHAHLFSANDTSRARAERDLAQYVAYGVTTIRNMDHNAGGYFYYSKGPGGPVDPTLQLRTRAAAGELVSPRIYTSGQWGPPNYTNFGGSYTGSRLQKATHGSLVRLDSIAAYVAAYKAAGYDFVKPYFEGDLVFDSLVIVTRRLGLPMAGHIPSSTDPSITLERVLASGGYRSVEHLDGDWYRLDETQLRAHAAATQRAKLWNTPTMAVGFAPALRDLRRRVLKALQDAGAGLLVGADATSNPIFTPMPRPGTGVHQELQALVEAGLTPYQALVAGTKNVAEYFGTLDSTGTVTVGKRADLVFLRGNPLADIRQTQELVGVMLGGRWLPR